MEGFLEPPFALEGKLPRSNILRNAAELIQPTGAAQALCGISTTVTLDKGIQTLKSLPQRLRVRQVDRRKAMHQNAVVAGARGQLRVILIKFQKVGSQGVTQGDSEKGLDFR